MVQRKSVPAAGTVPWRLDGDRLQVALVHRPRYDDWSWAKGKLDPGEEWACAAVRETWEEAGVRVRLGRPLPDASYQILDRDHTFSTKLVRYWAATVTGGDGRLTNEIDEVAWLTPEEAHSRLDYSRDQDQLLALVALHRHGELDTWPLILVRHASALPRGRWSGKDRLRPLDDEGRTRSQELIPLLGAYGPLRVVTSSATRCTETMAPFVAASGSPVRTRRSLSEEGFEEDPAKALRRMEKLIARGRPAAVCSHRPLVPDLTDLLLRRAGHPDVSELLGSVRAEGMDKGEALVAHISGTGPQARVVAVERHFPA